MKMYSKFHQNHTNSWRGGGGQNSIGGPECSRGTELLKTRKKPQTERWSQRTPKILAFQLNKNVFKNRGN